MSFVTGKDLKRRSGINESTSSMDIDIYQTTYGGPPSKIGTASHQVTDFHEWFVGFDNPNYHRRVRNGELLPHTYWHQFRTNGSSSGTHDISLTDGRRIYTTPGYNEFTDWIIDNDHMLSLAPDTPDYLVNEAAAKIYGQGYDLLTALAELVEVREMFFRSGKLLINLLSEKRFHSMMRRFKRFTYREKLDTVIGSWMAGRYGWRPLFYDMFNINEMITTWNEKRSRYNEKQYSKSTTFDVTVTPIEKHDYYLENTTQDTIKTSLVGSVTADIEVPKLQFNPFQTGWELIPLSFVVDWFWTVGKSLSALSFLAHETKYTSSAGFRVEVTREFTSVISAGKPAYFSSGNRDQVGTCEASLEVRKPCKVPYTPHFTLRLNPYKILDLLSIIVQRIH